MKVARLANTVLHARASHSSSIDGLSDTRSHFDSTPRDAPLRVKVCKKIHGPRDTIASATMPSPSRETRLYRPPKPVGLSEAQRASNAEVIAAPSSEDQSRRARRAIGGFRAPRPRSPRVGARRVRRPEPCGAPRPRSRVSGPERAPRERRRGTHDGPVASHNENIFGDGTGRQEWTWARNQANGSRAL